VRRVEDVAQVGIMEVFYALRIASMFPGDTELQNGVPFTNELAGR
jgi:hypothetical protein